MHLPFDNFSVITHTQFDSCLIFIQLIEFNLIFFNYMYLSYYISFYFIQAKVCWIIIV